MKILFTLLLISFIGFNTAKSQVTDTLYLAYKKPLMLLFDETPTFNSGSLDVLPQVNDGDNKLILRYAYEEEIPFKETNLFVQSGNKYYVFIIKHSETPKQFLFNYQTQQNQITLVSDGKKDSVITTTKKVEALQIDYAKQNQKKEANKKVQLVQDYYKINSSYVDYQKQEIFNKGVIGKGKVNLMLTNLYVLQDHLFFKFTISNKSRIKYDLSAFKFFITPKKGKLKKTASADIELYPLYIYNDSVKTIQGKSQESFVVVLDKFTLENDKKVLINTIEKNGERSMEFTLFAEDLYNTKTIER